MLPVILVHVFNAVCGYRMVLFGEALGTLSLDFVGIGLLVIVLSIVVFGCFGLVCACLNLFGSCGMLVSSAWPRVRQMQDCMPHKQFGGV